MYPQIFPRDLFNNAKLIKCLGQLILNLEGSHIQIDFKDYLNNEIDIKQDSSDGSIHVDNMVFTLKSSGDELRLHHPLNSKKNYPLVLKWSDDEIKVFNDNGNFSDEFLIWYSHT